MVDFNREGGLEFLPDADFTVEVVLPDLSNLGIPEIVTLDKLKFQPGDDFLNGIDYFDFTFSTDVGISLPQEIGAVEFDANVTEFDGRCWRHRIGNTAT